jgi:hypothetical protein
MKKEWDRHTRQCDYTQLRPELRVAIEKELKVMEEELDILFCIETESILLKKSGLFNNRRKVQYVAAIVTPRWLVQAVELSEFNTEVIALFHYFDKMQITFETMEMGKAIGIEDYGIDVLSQTRWNLRGGRHFIGLEYNAVSQQFIEALKDAIKAVKA